MNEELKAQLVELLENVHQAHAEAYAEVNGVDPDWPIWYADRIHPAARQLLGPDLHKSQLIYCLMDAEK